MGDSLQDRYAAVERLYSQGQWQQTLEASAALLAELPQQGDDPLRTRLILLQGHTQLYGLGQIEAAAGIYQQVLDSPAEPLLQTIAAQELERCRQQQSAAVEATSADAAEAGDTTVAEAPLSFGGPSPSFPFTAQAMGADAGPQQQSAMPWLEALGGVDPSAATATTAATAGATPAAAPWLDNGTQTEPSQPANSVTEQPADPPPPVAQPPQQEVLEATIADVIDEPEQVEVLQADPKRAELLDLTPVAEVAEASSTGRWSPAEEAELAKGLLRVVLS